ncbi:MAG TPA: aldehyde dehydrogenase family protein [Flavisolibacter sp.]|jgi:2,5-dioxopentanoate dehydrogenase|nr:aldehyde dehydrogenase family protein [Flavisolibacter sp.]
MFNGCNYIGFRASAKSNKKIKVFSISLQEYLHEEFTVAITEELELAMEKANLAFEVYKKIFVAQRADFLEAISEEITNIGDLLIRWAALETGLPEERLTGERTKTVNQLKLFASVLDSKFIFL